MGSLPAGCPFEPRCTYRVQRSAEEAPALLPISPGHYSACWVAQQGGL
jgi:ABC-type dipeptide/oligopeptide/nickel transport system ATPase component